MSRTPNIFLKTAIISYAILLTLCNPNDKAPPSHERSSSEISTSLSQKHNGILLSKLSLDYTDELLKTILEKPVVMDTVIIGTINRGGKYFFKAIINNTPAKIFALLQCSKDIYRSYLVSGLTSFIVTADITRVQTSDISFDFETIDHELLTFNAGKEVILTGTCLEMLENPERKNIITKNLN
jgi:hypothetical protein